MTRAVPGAGTAPPGQGPPAVDLTPRAGYDVGVVTVEHIARCGRWAGLPARENKNPAKGGDCCKHDTNQQWELEPCNHVLLLFERIPPAPCPRNQRRIRPRGGSGSHSARISRVIREASGGLAGSKSVTRMRCVRQQVSRRLRNGLADEAGRGPEADPSSLPAAIPRRVVVTARGELQCQRRNRGMFAPRPEPCTAGWEET